MSFLKAYHLSMKMILLFPQDNNDFLFPDAPYTSDAYDIYSLTDDQLVDPSLMNSFATTDNAAVMNKTDFLFAEEKDDPRVSFLPAIIDEIGTEIEARANVCRNSDTAKIDLGYTKEDARMRTAEEVYDFWI